MTFYGLTLSPKQRAVRLDGISHALDYVHLLRTGEWVPEGAHIPLLSIDAEGGEMLESPEIGVYRSTSTPNLSFHFTCVQSKDSQELMHYAFAVSDDQVVETFKTYLRQHSCRMMFQSTNDGRMSGRTWPRVPLKPEELYQGSAASELDRLYHIYMQDDVPGTTPAIVCVIGKRLSGYTHLINAFGRSREQGTTFDLQADMINPAVLQSTNHAPHGSVVSIDGVSESFSRGGDNNALDVSYVDFMSALYYGRSGRNKVFFILRFEDDKSDLYQRLKPMVTSLIKLKTDGSVGDKRVADLVKDWPHAKKARLDPVRVYATHLREKMGLDTTDPGAFSVKSGNDNFYN